MCTVIIFYFWLWYNEKYAKLTNKQNLSMLRYWSIWMCNMNVKYTCIFWFFSIIFSQKKFYWHKLPTFAKHNIMIFQHGGFFFKVIQLNSKILFANQTLFIEYLTLKSMVKVPNQKLVFIKTFGSLVTQIMEKHSPQFLAEIYSPIPTLYFLLFYVCVYLLISCKWN